MRTVVRKYRALLIFLIGGLASAIIATCADRALAQDAPVEMMIRRSSYAIDDAVRIVGFRLDGNYYDFEKDRALPPINTTPGWLERLQFVVKNISPKTFVAGTIWVNCPSINHGPREQMIVDQFTLGIVPGRFRSSSSQTLMALDAARQPISVEPGQEVSFVLGNDFDRMRKKIPQGGPFPDCTVDPRNFFFSDGTMWSSRHFYKPDPSSDHGYINMTPEEFGIDVPAQYR